MKVKIIAREILTCLIILLFIECGNSNDHSIYINKKYRIKKDGGNTSLLKNENTIIDAKIKYYKNKGNIWLFIQQADENNIKGRLFYEVNRKYNVSLDSMRKIVDQKFNADTNIQQLFKNKNNFYLINVETGYFVGPLNHKAFSTYNNELKFEVPKQYIINGVYNSRSR